MSQYPPVYADALSALKEAVRLGPGFSRAWSTLSEAYVAAQGPVDQALYMPMDRASARDAAQRAIALYGKNGQAYAALAAATDRADSWNRIDALHAAALKFEPSNIEALYGAGSFYADAGFTQKSIELLRRARSLDPLNPLSTFLLVRVLEAGSDNAGLDDLVAQAGKQWPDNRSLWRFTTRHAIWKNRLGDAAAALKRTPKGAEGDAQFFADLIACRKNPASPRMETFLGPARGGPIPQTWPILIFALGMLGQAAPCVALIRRIYLSPAGRQKAQTWPLFQAMLRPVWREAGLKDVFRELGLYDYWATQKWRPPAA